MYNPLEDCDLPEPHIPCIISLRYLPFVLIDVKLEMLAFKLIIFIFKFEVVDYYNQTHPNDVIIGNGYKDD